MATNGSQGGEIPDEASEVWHVHYPDADQAVEEVFNAVVEADQNEMGDVPPYRQFVLSRGDRFHPPEERADDPFAFGAAEVDDEDRDIETTVVRDEPVAVGYFLHMAETHAIARDQLLEPLRERAPEWVDTYEAWVDGLSVRERRLRLIDLLEWRVEDGEDWVAGIYLNEKPCTWRSTNLSDDGEQATRRIEDAIDVRPSMCYRTAQMAALYAFDEPTLADRVEYVEGVALPSDASQAIRHAWIEIDGEVAELTWPWHQYDGADAVYFGVLVDPAEVREARLGRELGGPVFVDEQDLPSLG